MTVTPLFSGHYATVAVAHNMRQSPPGGTGNSNRIVVEDVVIQIVGFVVVVWALEESSTLSIFGGV